MWNIILEFLSTSRIINQTLNREQDKKKIKHFHKVFFILFYIKLKFYQSNHILATLKFTIHNRTCIEIGNN